MADSNFDFTFLEAQFTVLTSNVQTYLQGLYNKANEIFSPASPYGQVLAAVEMIFSALIAMQKNIVNQYDLSNPDNLNNRTIRTLASLAGHNPVRAQSATGTLSMQLRPGITISEDIPGSKITIINRTKLLNNTNNLNYYIDLGTDSTDFYLDNATIVHLPVVQGIVEIQIFTSSGLINQSFSVVVPNGRNVENNIVTVSVNGTIWTKVDSLWDMAPNTMSYFTRTGFQGGLEVWFGNNSFGLIPPVGAQIQVQYVSTDGATGNLPQSQSNDWTFVEDIYDGNGGTVDVNSLFFVFIEDEISFGADSESLSFMKAIIPFTSRNFVLARPEQFEYVLGRLNVFSQIKAYTSQKANAFDPGNPNDDAIVYLFLVPNFRNFLLSGSNNYFDLPESVFTLDATQQAKVITYLNTMGTVAVGTGVQIVSPTLSLYVINITTRIYANFTQSNVKQSIIDAISNYFITTTRRDRIPVSDLIVALDGLPGIDSLSLQFVSADNEAYHATYVQYQQSVLLANPTVDPNSVVLKGYDPTKVIGLDPQLGDILIDKGTLAIVRGGFSDRYGVKYAFAPQDRGLGAVNVIFESTVSPTVMQSSGLTTTSGTN